MPVLTEEVPQAMAEQIGAEVERYINSLVSQIKKAQEKEVRGYLNQTKAQKYVGSKALLEKLENNGLGRYVIDGTIRYKVADIDDAMDLFRE
ncbi:hypothetical protein [Jeotgalibaca porci]|uniref:hypothetical protein n=1 Tax=Jeotgalibaca porci TaxID=1868793 RepID=UPI0035A0D403